MSTAEALPSPSDDENDSYEEEYDRRRLEGGVAFERVLDDQVIQLRFSGNDVVLHALSKDRRYSIEDTRDDRDDGIRVFNQNTL